MTNHGFIDPDAPTRERLDRIELLITEALSQLDRSHLSPEVRAILDDLDSGNPDRLRRAQHYLKDLMDADPIDDTATPTELPNGLRHHGCVDDCPCDATKDQP